MTICLNKYPVESDAIWQDLSSSQRGLGTADKGSIQMNTSTASDGVKEGNVNRAGLNSAIP